MSTLSFNNAYSVVVPDSFEKMDRELVSKMKKSDYPESWMMMKDEKNHILLEFMDQKTNFLNNLLSLEKVAKSSLDLYKRKIKNMKNEKIFVEEIHGIEVAGFISDYESEGIPCIQKYTVFRHEKMLYVVYYAIRKENYRESFPIAESVVQSISIKNMV